MKIVVQLISALGAFVVAEQLRWLLQSRLQLSGLVSGPEPLHLVLGSTQSFVLANVAVYLLVFAAAGVVMGVLASSRWSALALATLVGVASPLSTLPYRSMEPFTWATHQPAWVEWLFWANWYVPPLAALLGVSAMLYVRAKAGAGEHAA